MAWDNQEPITFQGNNHSIAVYWEAEDIESDVGRNDRIITMVELSVLDVVESYDNLLTICYKYFYVLSITFTNSDIDKHFHWTHACLLLFDEHVLGLTKYSITN